MTKNIAENERVFRVISGGLISSMAFWRPENNVFLLGIIPLVTGIIGTCPLYCALGFSSASRATVRRGKPTEKKHEQEGH